MLQLPIILGLLLLLTGCGVPGPQRVQVHVQSPHWEMRDPLSRVVGGMSPIRGPGTPFDSLTQFECFFVSVVGKGVPTTFDDGFEPPTDSVLTPSCLGFGRVSKLVSLDTLRNVGISMELESGSERLIQVVGFTPPGGLTSTTCDGQTFKQTAVVNQPTAPMFFKLGQVKVDLNKDALVNIPSSYDPTTAKEMEASCPENSLTLVPSVFYHGTASGDANGVGYGDLLYSNGTPVNLPPVTTGTESMMNFEAIGPGSVFNGGHYASIADYARVDVLFDVTNIDLSGFSSMRLRSIAGGGLDAGGGSAADGCNVSAGIAENTTNSGFELRVWKPDGVGSGKWVDSQKTVFDHQVRLRSYSFSNMPPAAVALVEEDSDATVAKGKYIHFTLRSRAGINFTDFGNNGYACSAIALELMTLKLIP